MTSSEIINTFNQEFLVIAHKFHFIEEKVSEAATSEKEYIYHPGVYIFFDSKNVIKIGRNLTNSRKRALEHIRDNTSNEHYQMEDLPKQEDAQLLFINVKHVQDYHWVAAVEIYLEANLDPKIKSQRS